MCSIMNQTNKGDTTSDWIANQTKVDSKKIIDDHNSYVIGWLTPFG